MNSLFYMDAGSADKDAEESFFTFLSTPTGRAVLHQAATVQQGGAPPPGAGPGADLSTGAGEDTTWFDPNAVGDAPKPWYRRPSTWLIAAAAVGAGAIILWPR